MSHSTISKFVELSIYPKVELEYPFAHELHSETGSSGFSLMRPRTKSKGDHGNGRKKSFERPEGSTSTTVQYSHACATHPLQKHRAFICRRSSIVEFNITTGATYKVYKLQRNGWRDDQHATPIFTKVDAVSVGRNRCHVVAATSSGTIIIWQAGSAHILNQTSVFKERSGRSSITTSTLTSRSGSSFSSQTWNSMWNLVATRGLNADQPRFLFYCQPGSSLLGIVTLTAGVAEEQTTGASAKTTFEPYATGSLDIKPEKKGITRRHGAPITLVAHRWKRHELGIASGDSFRIYSYDPGAVFSKKGWSLRLSIAAAQVSQALFHQEHPLVVLVQADKTNHAVEGNEAGITRNEPVNTGVNVNVWHLGANDPKAETQYVANLCFSTSLENVVVSVSLHSFWPILLIVSAGEARGTRLNMWDVLDEAAGPLATLDVAGAQRIDDRTVSALQQRPNMNPAGAENGTGATCCLLEEFRFDYVLLASSGQSAQSNSSHLGTVSLIQFCQQHLGSIFQPIMIQSMQEPQAYYMLHTEQQQWYLSKYSLTDKLIEKKITMNSVSAAIRNAVNSTRFQSILQISPSEELFAVVVKNKALENTSNVQYGSQENSLWLLRKETHNDQGNVPSNCEAFMLLDRCGGALLVGSDLVAAVQKNDLGECQVSVLSIWSALKSFSATLEETRPHGSSKYVGVIPPPFTVCSIYETPFQAQGSFWVPSADARVILYLLVSAAPGNQCLCLSANAAPNSVPFDFSPALGSQFQNLFLSEQSSPGSGPSLGSFQLDQGEHVVDIAWQPLRESVAATDSAWAEEVSSPKLAVLTNRRLLSFSALPASFEAEECRLLGSRAPGVSVAWIGDLVTWADASNQLHYCAPSREHPSPSRLGTLDARCAANGSIPRLLGAHNGELFVARVLGASCGGEAGASDWAAPSVSVQFRPVFITGGGRLVPRVVQDPHTCEKAYLLPGLTDKRLREVLNPAVTNVSEFVEFCSCFAEVTRFASAGQVFGLGLSLELVLRMVHKSQALMTHPIDTPIDWIIANVVGLDSSDERYQSAEEGSFVTCVKRYYQKHLETIGRLTTLLQNVWGADDLALRIGPLLCASKALPALKPMVERILNSLSKAVWNGGIWGTIDAETTMMIDALARELEGESEQVQSKLQGGLELSAPGIDRSVPLVKSMLVASRSILDDSTVSGVGPRKMPTYDFVSNLHQHPSQNEDEGVGLAVPIESSLSSLGDWVGVASRGDSSDRDEAVSVGGGEGMTSEFKNCIASQQDMCASFDCEDAVAGYWRFDPQTHHRDLTPWGNDARWDPVQCHMDELPGECPQLSRGQGAQVPLGRALVLEPPSDAGESPGDLAGEFPYMTVPFAPDSVFESASQVAKACADFTIESWVRICCSGETGVLFGRRLEGCETLRRARLPQDECVPGTWVLEVDPGEGCFEATFAASGHIVCKRSPPGSLSLEREEWIHVSFAVHVEVTELDTSQSIDSCRLTLVVNNEELPLEDIPVESPTFRPQDPLTTRELVVGQDLRRSAFMEVRYWLKERTKLECSGTYDYPLDIAKVRRKFMVVISNSQGVKALGTPGRDDNTLGATDTDDNTLETDTDDNTGNELPNAKEREVEVITKPKLSALERRRRNRKSNATSTTSP